MLCVHFFVDAIGSPWQATVLVTLVLINVVPKGAQILW